MRYRKADEEPVLESPSKKTRLAPKSTLQKEEQEDYEEQEEHEGQEGQEEHEEHEGSEEDEPTQVTRPIKLKILKTERVNAAPLKDLGSNAIPLINRKQIEEEDDNDDIDYEPSDEPMENDDDESPPPSSPSKRMAGEASTSSSRNDEAAVKRVVISLPPIEKSDVRRAVNDPKLKKGAVKVPVRKMQNVRPRFNIRRDHFYFSDDPQRPVVDQEYSHPAVDWNNVMYIDVNSPTDTATVFIQNTPIDTYALQMKIKMMKEENQKLCQKFFSVKKQHDDIIREYCEYKNNCYEEIVKRFFNPDQLKCMLLAKQKEKNSFQGGTWSEETLKKCQEIQAVCGADGYQYLRNKLGWPMPAPRQMQARGMWILSGRDFKNYGAEKGSDLATKYPEMENPFKGPSKLIKGNEEFLCDALQDAMDEPDSEEEEEEYRHLLVDREEDEQQAKPAAEKTKPSKKAKSHTTQQTLVKPATTSSSLPDSQPSTSSQAAASSANYFVKQQQRSRAKKASDFIDDDEDWSQILMW